MVIAEGRLVNLGAAHGHPASVMDIELRDSGTHRPNSRSRTSKKLT